MNFKAITEKIKELSSEKKKAFIIAAAVVIAMPFLLLTSTSDDSDLQQNTETQTTSTFLSINDIQKETENRLEEIIRNVQGAGNVRVMVTLASSGEYVYAENSKKENNGDKSSLDSEIVIYESDKGNDGGLIVSVKSAEITGVAVVCDGGGSAVVRAEITELVTSLFGIGADRVYVGSNV